MDAQPRITLADLARNLGVSTATVSLALRNRDGASEETRRRVHEEAERLGYQMRARPTSPSTHTRSARSGPRGSGGVTAKNVGVIIKARADDDPHANEFYSRVLAGIEAACRSHRLNLLLGTVLVDNQNRPLEVPALLEDGGADGLLVVGMQVHGELFALLRSRHPTLVLVDAYAPRTSNGGCDAVLSNNSAGGAAAANLLLEAGHRHITVVGASADAYPSLRDRYQGFVDTVTAHRDCRLHSAGSSSSPEEAAALLTTLIRQSPEISACFGGNDLYAIAAIRAVQALGRCVPDDFAVVGFDGIALGEHTTPPLTTLEVDKLKMGRMAVEMLLDRLAFPDAAPAVATITPRLIERASVKQAR